MRECYITEDGVGLAFINIEAFNILFQQWRSWGNGLYHKKGIFVLKIIKENTKRCSYNAMVDFVPLRKLKG
jgi:hypothetical protein